MGLNIHKGKIIILKVNAASMEPIKLEGFEIEEVETFAYLDSVIDKQSGIDGDNKARIDTARGTFIPLKMFWSSKKHPQIRLFNSIVKSVLLYGADTWGQLTPAPRKYTPLSKTV